MLPNFPKVRSTIGKFLRDYLEIRTSAHSGILQQMKKKVALHECNKYDQHRFDGSTEKQPLSGLSSKITISKTDLDEKGFAAVLEAYDRAAKDVADKQTSFIFGRFDEIVESTGQSFDAGGKQLTMDLLLDILDKTEIDFDEQGQPNLPTLFSGRAFHETAQKWTITDEQEKRFEEIIERKWFAWRDRESDRRLVD